MRPTVFTDVTPGMQLAQEEVFGPVGAIIPFDTEAEAIAYGQQWKLMKHADIPPPAELTTPTSTGDSVRLVRILGEWSDSGFAAPSQILTLKTLTLEVGSVRFSDANYKWLTGYLRSLKVEKNLSPSSIKHRIQALSRAIDEYLRHNVNVKISNPVKLLPKGYSTYTDVDAQMAKAKGGKVKVNVARDRRLLPGEHEKIVAVLSGYERPDRSRGLELKGRRAGASVAAEVTLWGPARSALSFGADQLAGLP